MCYLWKLREISVLSLYFKGTEVTEEYLGVSFGSYLKRKVHSISNIRIQQSEKWQNFSEWLQHQNLIFQVLVCRSLT